MKFSQHIQEQKLVDYVLGNLDRNEQFQIQQHLDQCVRCKKIMENWSMVLNKEETSFAQPSPLLKEKLWAKIEQNHKSARQMRKPKLIFGLSSLAVILIFMIGLFYYNKTMEKSYEVAKNDEIPQETIQTKPDTKQIAIVPVSHFNHINGTIWINKVTEEMLLEVNGLTNLHNKDYQLWIIYSNDEIIGEILAIQNGSSRIFFKGEDVNHFKYIKASVEPKGGSTLPTGPETFQVDLKE